VVHVSRKLLSAFKNCSIHFDSAALRTIRLTAGLHGLDGHRTSSMPCSLTNAHVVENLIHCSMCIREGPIGATFAHAFNKSELTFQLDLEVTVHVVPESRDEQSLGQRGVIVILRASARNGKYTSIGCFHSSHLRTPNGLIRRRIPVHHGQIEA